MSNSFKELSSMVSVDDSGSKIKFLINDQWIFSVPKSMEYETDVEFEDMGDTDEQVLVLREPNSKHPTPFNAAVNEYEFISEEYMTAEECRNDGRFGESDDIHEIILDTPELYVDFIAVALFVYGIGMEVRVRGKDITAFDIYKTLEVENVKSRDHFCNMFREIARSIQIKPELSHEEEMLLLDNEITEIFGESSEMTEKRKAEYESILEQIEEQKKIAEANKGGFLGMGKKAQTRKEALKKIAELQKKLKDYSDFLD